MRVVNARWEWIYSPMRGGQFKDVVRNRDGTYMFYALYHADSDMWMEGGGELGNKMLIISGCEMVTSMYSRATTVVRDRFRKCDIVPVTCKNMLVPGRTYNVTKAVKPDFSMVFPAFLVAKGIDNGDETYYYYNSRPKIP